MNKEKSQLKERDAYNRGVIAGMEKHRLASKISELNGLIAANQACIDALVKEREQHQKEWDKNESIIKGGK